MIVRLELSRNPYDRYLYGLVFALTTAGHQVRATPHPLLMSDIDADQYARHIPKIPGFSWSTRRRFERALRIGDIDAGGAGRGAVDVVLDPDYFRAPASTREVHLPIGQHPLMFIDGRWNSPIDMECQRSSLPAFAGNLDPAAYGNPDFVGPMQQVFGVTLRHLIAAVIDPSLARLSDARSAMVERTDWRAFLQANSFFLALPGCQMPHAHNLSEAMSAGCIPVIDRSYAELLRPALQHGVNAWFYDGPHDINDRLREVAALDAADVRRLRAGVVQYSDQWLSPAAAARMITAPGVERAFLMAENPSVQALLRRIGWPNGSASALTGQ